MNRRITAMLRLMAALGAIAAPALAAQVVAAQSASAQTVAPTVMDPYAWSGPQLRNAQAASQAYGGPQRYDRYGGGVVHPPIYGAPPAPAYGRLLTWSGKVDRGAAAPDIAPEMAQAPAPFAAPAGHAAQAQAAPDTAYAAYASPYPAAGRAPVAPAYAPPAPAYAAPRPASIYDTPPPSPSAGSDGGTARRYSVHREYGMAPDPIPLPPQFFGATADPTQPETSEPPRRVMSADGKARNAVQPAETP